MVIVHNCAECSNQQLAQIMASRLEEFATFLPLRNSVNRNIGQVFVLVLLLATSLLVYLAPDKITFLSFHCLPTMLTAYYLRQRMAIPNGILCFTTAHGISD